MVKRRLYRQHRNRSSHPDRPRAGVAAIALPFPQPWRSTSCKVRRADRAFLLDADPESSTFAQIRATIALPALHEPLDPDLPPLAEEQQLRLPALTPDGQWGFVTHGGDGLVSVINTAQANIIQQLEVPTPLGRWWLCHRRPEEDEAVGHDRTLGGSHPVPLSSQAEPRT